MPINLDLLFERTIRSLNMISDGKTASLEGIVHGAGAPDRSPKATETDDRGRPDYTIDQLVVRYSECESSEKRRDVISDALEELHKAKYAPDRSKRRGTLEWKEAIAADQRPVTVIARIFDVSRPTVYDFRRQMKRAA